MYRRDKYRFTQYIQDLWNYIKPFKIKFLTAFFLRLVSDIARLYPPMAISQIVQILSGGIVEDSYKKLISIFIYWGMTALYVGIFHNFSKLLGYQVAESASLNFYKDTLSHIFKLDFSWQEKENSGNKLKRIDKGSDGVNNSIRRIFDVLIEVVVNIVGVSIIFFGINKYISLALLFYVFTYFLVGTRFLKRAIRQEALVNKSFEDLSGISFESLNNIQTIKSLSIDNGILKTADNHIKSLLLKVKKRIFYFQSFRGILNFYESIFQYSVILILGMGVYNGSYTVGFLILFVGLFERISASSSEMTNVVQELTKSKIWMSRAKRILMTTPKIEAREIQNKQLIYNRNWKKIFVNSVTFSYKNKLVLDNVSFDVKRGEKIGIVGLSGAGKSTLFKLFLDLYENYQGDILLDNISLKKIRRQSYIDHVSVVLQDTELFNMSLRANIEIASVKKNKNRDLLNEVLDKSHLEDVVGKLPQGVNTLVGEKGIKLSGGQRQRLGIARALYRQPDILLLDEATSHLDSYSENEIQKAILENVNQFTTIVIAHRLSTIKVMDKIVVLDNGKVVEQGDFDELINKKGKFFEMWNSQKI